MPDTKNTTGVRPPDSRPPDSRPPINAAWLERMRAGKPEFLAQLFAVFLAEEPQRIARLSAAVAAGDVKMLLHLAHALRGAAATMGMERLSDACRTLELAAKGGESATQRAAFALVDAEIEAVFRVIREY